MFSHQSITKETVSKTYFDFESRLFGLSIAGLVYSFALSRGSLSVLIVAQALFILYVSASIAMRGNTNLFSVSSLLFALLITLVLSINIVANSSRLISSFGDLSYPTTHAIGVLTFLFIGIWGASNLQLQTVLETVCLTLFPLIASAIIVGAYDPITGRTWPFDIHPNWWGEVAFGFTLCAIALRNRLAAFVSIFIAFWLMVLVESRGAMLASVVSITVFMCLKHSTFDIFKVQRFSLLLLGSACILLLAYFGGLINLIIETIATKVILINDPYRGVGSGLTGRVEGWIQAAYAFINRPIMGIGFDNLMDVHNGFLRLAGEGGLALLVPILLLMAFSLVRSFADEKPWQFAVVLGFSAYLITFPRALNMNLVSIIFYLAIFTSTINQRYFLKSRST